MKSSWKPIKIVICLHCGIEKIGCKDNECPEVFYRYLAKYGNHHWINKLISPRKRILKSLQSITQQLKARYD